ncbi:hypothetical protein [Candidatus Leptofilum sp.]|uniref:hypothetical protein n=1 Tax=Candidatus Leptofilum sp. TaxID=3241576 RepID=UPI003B5C7CF7
MNKVKSAHFQQWLSTATDSLPDHVIQVVTQEFKNHYLDAIDDLLEQGLSEKEARTQGLANLGQAETVGRCLKDVHLGQRHYKVAAVASMLILAVLLFFPAFIGSFLPGNPVAEQVGHVLTGSLLAMLTAYVLNTLRRLLIWRFALQKLDRFFKIAIASYLLWITADIVSLILYNAPLYIGSLRALNEAVNSFDKLLITAAWIGQIGLGTTGMMIALSLWQSQDGLYRIGKLLAICLGVMAVPIGLAALATNLGLTIVVSILTMFVVLGHILVWPVSAMLFVRAVFRPPNTQPPQLI